MTLCPKHPRIEDKAYLKHVSELPCIECHTLGAVAPHHLLKFPGEYRGTGRKLGDNRTIPMCNDHHRALHDVGSEIKYFGKMGALYAIDMSIKLWKDWEDNGNI